MKFPNYVPVELVQDNKNIPNAISGVNVAKLQTTI